MRGRWRVPTGRVDKRLVVAANVRPARLTREERTMSLTTTEGLTIADLDAMPDDGHRYELLGGSIVVNAAPTPRHQLASGTLYDRLKAACPSDHLVLYAPVDLDLPGGQRVEPDLVVAPTGSIGDLRLRSEEHTSELQS